MVCDGDAVTPNLRLALYRSLNSMQPFQPFLRELADVLDADVAELIFKTNHAGTVEAVTFSHPEEAMNVPVKGEEPAIAVTVRLHQDLEVALTVRRLGMDPRPFSAADRRTLENLVDELENACRLFVKHAGAERERRAYRKSLDRLGVGLLLVDSSFRLMATNGIGGELLRSGDFFTVAHGCVKLATTAATRKLELAVLNAIASQDDPDAQRGEPILIPRANGEAALTAFVYPGPQPYGFAQPLLRTAVILVSEPGRKSCMTVEDVMPLFGLTRAEAALAIRLADGESLTEASAGLGITRNTARAQLNAIFQKAGVVRQSELVRHLLNSAAICALTGGDERLPSATGARLQRDGI